MMRAIHELEAWSLPGRLLDPEYGKDVLQHEIWQKGIPKDVFLGISAIPDEVDCRNLKRAIKAGEYTISTFETFCSEHGLSASLDSPESCAQFLEFMEGRCLAWIHMPPEDESTLLPVITKALEERGHIIVEPYLGS